MDYSQYKKLEFRRKFWKIAGAEIYIDDPTTQTEVGYIKMKAWKLREDIRIFHDRTMAQELVAIHGRQIIDFGATYDVTDSASNQQIFSLRRKGLKSTFVRDHWDLLDNNGNALGAIQETSGTLALVRRWIGLLPFGDLIGLVFMFVPQTYIITVQKLGGETATIGTIVHRKNPFIVKMTLDTSAAEVAINPFITLSATALLSIIDAVKS